MNTILKRASPAIYYIPLALLFSWLPMAKSFAQPATNYAVINMSVAANGSVSAWAASFNLMTVVDPASTNTSYTFLQNQPQYPIVISPVVGYGVWWPFATHGLMPGIIDQTAGNQPLGCCDYLDSRYNFGADIPTGDQLIFQLGWMDLENDGWWPGSPYKWNLPPVPSGRYDLVYDSTGNLTSPTCTINVQSAPNGTATAAPNAGFPGSIAALTAIPSAGYVFVSWTVNDAGGGSLSSAIASSTIFTFGPTNASITPNFAPVPTFALSVTASPPLGGSVSADPTSGVAGSISTLVATPFPGYVFAAWALGPGATGSLSAPTASSTSFTFGGSDASITAFFVPVLSGEGSLYAHGANIKPPGQPDRVQEPVDTGTGAHVLHHTVLKVRGAQDLAFVIDYDSLCRFNDVVGQGWSHNFEASIRPSTNGAVQLNWNAKSFNVFSPQAGNTNALACADLPVIYDSLVRNADGSFTLREPSQRRFEFDSSGRLQQIVNPHGQAIQLLYSAPLSCPTQIVETVSGKTLNLSYNSSGLLSQVADALLRTAAFAYDSSNRLTTITITNATQSQTYSFAYDSQGRVLSETDPEGVVVFTNTYDSQGRVSTQADALAGSRPACFYYDESEANLLFTTVVDRTGTTNVYVHNALYQLLSFTDPLGHTTSYGYDARGDRITVTNALGHAQSFAYDLSGNRISATDAAGFTTTFQYDSRNNLTNLINALTNVASFTCDSNNNVTVSVDFMTNQTSMAYNTNAQLAQIVSPRGGTNTFAHSGGLLSCVTDAVGNTTSMAYDAVGRLTAVTNAAGFVSTNAYDLNDNLIAAADGLGDVWHYTFDSAGRRLSSTDPLGNSTFFAYNGNGDLLATTNALGGVTTYGYDGEDRLVSVTDANGHTRTMAYDAAGRLVAVVDALSHTNSFQYDAVGNATATIDALGITNQVNAYDARNQPVGTQDALGNQKRQAYDALQRLIQCADALHRTNSLGYDALSRLTASTDPLSLVTQQQFDGDGNRTAIINPKSAQFSFQYDLAERLTNSITATGRRTAYTLDGRNFLTNVVQPSGAQTVLAYDAAGRLTNSQDSVGAILYTYDSKGRVLSVTENGSTITRQYDPLDRLTNYTDAAGNVIQYAYDAVGNLTNLTYPDGKQVAYAYDTANRLVSVTDWVGRVTSYAYDADNRLTVITHADGTLTTRAYDIAGRLIHQSDTSATSNIIYLVDYGYDPAGQIIAETNQPPAAPFLPSVPTMAYDADDALTNFCGQTIPNDANGNMIYGPLTNGSFAAYVYDARNRLTSCGGLSYGYDPIGNRVAVTNGWSIARFVVNPNAPLSQVLLRIHNGLTNYYVYGVGLLYEVTPSNGTNAILNYHSDYRGSTVAITDAAGNVTDRVSYSPYGGIASRTGTTDTPFLFNGAYGVQTDPNGLLHMRARFYNTTICRFVNRDPIGMAGGLNSYAYANGNPINNLDPFGLFDLDTVLKGLHDLTGNAIQIVAATIMSGGTATIWDAVVVAPSIAHAAVTLVAGIFETKDNQSIINVGLERIPSNWGQWGGALAANAFNLNSTERSQLMGTLGFLEDAYYFWRDWGKARGVLLDWQAFMGSINTGVDLNDLITSLIDVRNSLSNKRCP